MRVHAPIVRTVTSAVFSYLLALAITDPSVSMGSGAATLLGWLLVGALYTQFVEYFFHRVPMHRGLPLLGDIKRHHLEHHRIFYGTNFKTRREEDLGHIAGRWWVFPLLFLGHYVVLVFLMAPDVLLAFLLGAVLHYVFFEVTHWFSHIEDNAFDRFLGHIPLLGALRAYQVEHHRIHHEVPELALNFNPPYLGDRIFRRMPRHAERLGYRVPGLSQWEPVLPPAVPDMDPSPVGRVFAEKPKRALVRYGSAVAIGVAVIGLAALAHGIWSHEKTPPPPEISA